MCVPAPKKDYKIEKDYRGTCADANNLGSLCHINSAQEAARLCDRIGSCTFFQWSGPRGFQRGAKDQYKNCVWLCNKVPPLLKSWRVGEEEKYRGWMAGSVFVPGKPSPSPTPPLMLKTNLELRLTGMTVTQFAKATAHKKNPFILGAAHFFKVSRLDVSVQSVKASGVGANQALVIAFSVVTHNAAIEKTISQKVKVRPALPAADLAQSTHHPCVIRLVVCQASSFSENLLKDLIAEGLPFVAMTVSKSSNSGDASSGGGSGGGGAVILIVGGVMGVAAVAVGGYTAYQVIMPRTYLLTH